MLGLGLRLAERRRAFVIASALGADKAQLRAFVATETAVLAVGGLVTATLLAALATVTAATIRLARRPPLRVLREL